MTEIDRFLASFSNFDELASEQQNELLLYFLTASSGDDSATASQVDKLRSQIGLPAFHTAQNIHYFSNRRRKDGQKYIKKPRGYALARPHMARISSLLGNRPAKLAVSHQLWALSQSINAGVQREYLEEAIGCFEANFHRAAIVLVWCLSYDLFRKWVFTKKLTAFNAITTTWKKSFALVSMEDFDELTERTVLDTARAAKVIGKEEHKILISLLDRRNSYAHPTGRTISASIAEAYIHEAIIAVLKIY